jgi:hypothetical protein
MDKKVLQHWPNMAAWVSDMFCDLYSMKNHKVANTSTTATAREKISTELESLEL